MPKRLAREEILKQFSIALKMESQEGLLPKVACSARGHLVDSMLKLAREKGVPIHEDPELAEGLQFLEIGDTVPDEFFPLLVEILFHVDGISKKLAELEAP
jgi:flagellar biosynthesis protein